MQGYIGYIRVSTVRQGTKGVSLQEQRDAIYQYADRNQFRISTWLQEMETAAKRGRPVFTQAMKLLSGRRAKGIILHKLDRGARNLKDWADIGELADQGIEVHFVNESLDLNSRGGRLSADIQAVVAADYIRNLREETRKGFYGRLKQGIYPLPAPLGYLNQGKGKPKIVDPQKGPLVRTAFELYATGQFNLHTLSEELYRRGLRTRKGRQVNRSEWSFLLNNPFYMGLMRIAKTGEVFPGIHQPLISRTLFDRVRSVLLGKTNVGTFRHAYLFRRLLTCTVCAYALVGERQKGHVYYRCHSQECSGTSLREDVVEAAFGELLCRIEFTEIEKAFFRLWIGKERKSWTVRRDTEISSLSMRLGQLKERLNRLTDAFLDGALDKAMFEERKEALFLERKTMEENLTRLSHQTQPLPDKLEQFLELAQSPWLSYKMGSPEEKRDLVKIITSNRLVNRKTLKLEPSIAFQDLVKRTKTITSPPYRDAPRTFEQVLENLAALNAQGLLPDVSKIFGCKDEDSEEEISVKE
jgi:site-specific DNA recombinase